jgi:hypothetical protein
MPPFTVDSSCANDVARPAATQWPCARRTHVSTTPKEVSGEPVLVLPEIDATVPADAEPLRKTNEQRRELMARQIQNSVAQGTRVQSQSEYQAVMAKGKAVNHVLHVLITVFTLGLWLPVWLILALTGGEKREMITVDEWGNVAVQKL